MGMTSKERSLYDQLVTLRDLANKNGLYDAADFITQTIKRARTQL